MHLSIRMQVHRSVCAISILALLLNQIFPILPFLSFQPVSAETQRPLREPSTNAVPSVPVSVTQAPNKSQAVPTAPDIPLLNQEAAAAALRSAPIMFIENVGQSDNGARFQVRGGNGSMYLADNALWFTALEQSNTKQSSHGPTANSGRLLRTKHPKAICPKQASTSNKVSPVPTLIQP